MPRMHFFFGKVSGVAVPPEHASDSIGSRIVGRYFSKKRFREIVDAQRAQEAAERKAQEVTGKRRVALARAAATAERAIVSVEDNRVEEEKAQLASLTRLLESATAAKSLSDMVRLANEAHRMAQAMLEEEEEAVMLLAMHE